jgi:hypothetical protein
VKASLATRNESNPRDRLSANLQAPAQGFWRRVPPGRLKLTVA